MIHQEGEKKAAPAHERTNRVQVSTVKPANFFVSISKYRLQDFDQIELHAVGNAASNAVIGSESLVR